MIYNKTLDTYTINRSDVVRIFEQWKKDITETGEKFDSTPITEIDDYGEKAADTFIDILSSLTGVI